MSIEKLDIVFVDDEQRILDGLRRQLYAHRQTWDMRFASSGAEALQMVETRVADIVVSDMRMPGMTGGQLFQKLLQTRPQITRIMLSGQTDQTELLRDVGCIHQYLQKPCEPLQLCHAIERTFSLAKRLRQPQLRLAANRIKALPPSSENHQALVAELSKEDSDIHQVSRIVGRDPALTAKLLQLVNSAFFGMPRKINCSHDAVVLLGLKTLRGIVIAGRLFDFVGKGRGHEPQLTRLWNISFEIGESARRLAAVDGAGDSAQHEARLAGLLSLIGRAILLTTEPDEYSNVLLTARSSERPLAQCEINCFGASQEDVTAYALGLWAFSDNVVSATAYQSSPSRMPVPSSHHPVRYLHLARWLRSKSAGEMEDRQELDKEFVESQQMAALVANQEKRAA